MAKYSLRTIALSIIIICIYFLYYAFTKILYLLTEFVDSIYEPIHLRNLPYVMSSWVKTKKNVDHRRDDDVSSTPF